ncbi:MAG: MBL fold metallo-hydrolase [bacterium]|nr:MBL fold metallo-hydrolase [bacterium]
MTIIWKGHSCFLITITRGKQEQVRLLIDPFGSDIGLRLSPQEADILLVTHDHADHSNTAVVKGAPFTITGPGEYEARDVFVQGISSYHDAIKGEERGDNTIYVIEDSGTRVCHLGDLGQQELTPEQVEQIGNVDVLFVPVGGTYTLDAAGASRVVSQIEPRIVVPMHYFVPGLKLKIDGVEKFLKVMGVKEEEPQPKLVLKGRDMKEDTSVVVLKNI